MTIVLLRAALLIALILHFASLGPGTCARAAAQTMVREARQAKAREDNAKRLRRRSMSRNEIDAYLWVEEHLAKMMVKNGVEVTLAKARAEVATAKAFHVEPMNWAKRDIGGFVENARTFERKRDEVERRFDAAKARTHELESQIMNTGKIMNPALMPGSPWYKEKCIKEPNIPYCVAVEHEHKVQREREEFYHQFNKETPEERVGGGLAILLVGWMLGGGGGAGLTGEAEAALGSLGEAETALAVTESDVAMTSIMKARAILIPADEETALAAVEEARTALAADNVESAAAAVEEAQSALKARLQVDPAAALALAAVNNVQAKIEDARDAEAKLDAAEKADADLGVKEKTKIDLYYYSSTHQDEVIKFLSGDLKAAIDYLSQYKAAVVKGEIVPTEHLQNALEEAAGVWTDPATGLMWAKENNDIDVDWERATDYCRNLQLAGHSDWRLPTIDELLSLGGQSTNDHTVFSYDNISNYLWSSSPGNAPGEALSMNFGYGRRFSLLLGTRAYTRARCVRLSGE